MSTFTFANGMIYTSSAQTPEQIQAVAQAILCKVLGIDPQLNPTGAFMAVRCAWQQEGQPSWQITDDVCVIRALPLNEPYGNVFGAILDVPSGGNYVSNFQYSQTWDVAMTFVGPNCFDRARIIATSLQLSYVKDMFEAANLYPKGRWNRPEFVPQNQDGQWWLRAELSAQFYENVTESVTLPAAESVQVTIITNTGRTETITAQV